MTKKTESLVVARKGMTGPVTINPTATESARIYAEEFARACKRAKVDPRIALVETDDYPKLMKWDQVEFMVGWLHGLAEAHELTPIALWDALFPAAKFDRLAKEVVELKAAWFGKKARTA